MRAEAYTLLISVLVASNLYAGPVKTSDGSDPNTRVAVIQRLRDIRLSATINDRHAREQLRSNLGNSFWRHLGYFIAPQYAPTQEFVRANLQFVQEAGGLGPSGEGADVAHLTFEIAGVEFTVAQTFSYPEYITISVESEESELENLRDVESAERLFEHYLDRYIIEDDKTDGMPVIDVVAIHNGYYGSVATTPKDYRQTFQGLVDEQVVCMVFAKRRFYSDGDADPIPRWLPPADKAFEFSLGQYSREDETNARPGDSSSVSNEDQTPGPSGADRPAQPMAPAEDSNRIPGFGGNARTDRPGF